MENADSLKGIGLSSLLTKYRTATEEGRHTDCQQIKAFIESQFTEKPWQKYKEAEEDLRKLMSDTPKELVESMLIPKQCAADIMDHLDPMHIDGFSDLEDIIAASLAKHKMMHQQVELKV